MNCELRIKGNIIGNRHPHYKTPEASLLWGYKCSSKALDHLKNRDIKSVQKAVYDVREAMRDALFLLGFRGDIDEAMENLKHNEKN